MKMKMRAEAQSTYLNSSHIRISCPNGNVTNEEILQCTENGWTQPSLCISSGKKIMSGSNFHVLCMKDLANFTLQEFRCGEIIGEIFSLVKYFWTGTSVLFQNLVCHFSHTGAVSQARMQRSDILGFDFVR